MAQHPADGATIPTFVRLRPTGAQSALDPEQLARTEWLLTSGHGGFAMGSVIGAPSRRYHGLLVAPLRPPVQRLMALNALAETLVIDPGAVAEQRVDLSTFRFRPGLLHPRGDLHLVKFEKDVSARWHFEVGDIAITKTVCVFREAAASAIRYTIRGNARPVGLLLRPIVSMRDFHALILRDTSRDRFRVEPSEAGCIVNGGGASLHLAASASGAAGEIAFRHDEQWWYDFQYEHERERGYDYLEDLFHPGYFECEAPVSAGAEASFTIHAGVNDAARRDMDTQIDHSRSRIGALAKATGEALHGRGPTGKVLELVVAADDFVVARPQRPGSPRRVSIIAGYPWFADWGRDAMISLPGLLLVPGRFEEAREVLRTFAANRKGGLIPNLFDDYSGEAHYNTVDASLWFIHAACLYRKHTDDAITFKNDLLPACLDVVDHYRRGTAYGIKMDDTDGLIFAGDAGTQLTWMDAKRDGVAFTPRHGKAVEINALWYNALSWLSEGMGIGTSVAADLSALRDKVGQSMRTLFWNPLHKCLYDTLQSPHYGAGWIPQAEIRPNQIFAVSLPHCALDPPQQRGVVDCVRTRLFTPLGLRTLDTSDSRYKGRFRGRMFERDAAYHNGTAWPWLLGPLAEAILRVGSFSPQARAEARKVLDGILNSLDSDCLGQIPEVFDGDGTPAEPQRSGGCSAQAWSVAEPLRVLTMIEKG